MKVGLISNPKSNANKRHGGLGAQVVPEADVLVARPATPDELKQDLSRFADEGVELIAVDGGDGTVRDIVTNIHRAYPADWPRFALLPSGKTNVIATHVGSFGKGSTGWRNLLAAKQAGTLKQAECDIAAVEVTWPNQPDRLLRGFLFGCAAFTEGVAMANETIHPKGIAKSLAVALAIGGTLKRALKSRAGGEIEVARDGRVMVDGQAINGNSHFLFMASTVDRLTMGIRPFRRQGSGDVLWLDVSGDARHLLTGGLMIALGKYRKWMLDSGYASGSARMIDLRFESPFILDGDQFDPSGHVRIAASRPIRFLGK